MGVFRAAARAALQRIGRGPGFVALPTDEGPGKLHYFQYGAVKFGRIDEGLPRETERVLFHRLARADLKLDPREAHASGNMAADLFGQCFGDGKFMHGRKSFSSVDPAAL